MPDMLPNNFNGGSFGGSTGMGTGGASVNAVSTNGAIALFAADSTMLRISFRNDTMFINIIPRVNDPTTGKGKWPREMAHIASLRPQHAAALWNGFKQAILPDIEKGQDHLGYVAVPLNRDGTTLVGFSYVGKKICFSIFNNVNTERTCSEVSSFICDVTPVINDYNPNTGAYSILEIQSQAYVLTYAIKTFAELASNWVGHGAKYATSYNNDMLMSHLQAIVTKLGVTPMGFGAYRGSNGGSFNRFGGGGMPGPMGGYSNDGPSATSNQLQLMQPPAPSNDGVAWNNAEVEASTVGHTAITPVQQVSQLSDLMG